MRRRLQEQPLPACVARAHDLSGIFGGPGFIGTGPEAVRRVRRYTEILRGDLLRPGGSASHGGPAGTRTGGTIAGSGEVVVRLEAAAAVLAESGRLVYRRGAVDWSLAAGGRGVVGKWLHRTQRRAAGMEARMGRYEGIGEVGFGERGGGRWIWSRPRGPFPPRA